MTDTNRDRLAFKRGQDGIFWMAADDFVPLSRRIKLARTFGPTWQSGAQYGRFCKEPPFTALARNNYRACEDNEISFKRGESLEVTKDSGFWLFGVHKETGKEGYIRKKDVDIKCQDTFKYRLTMSNVASDARIIVGVFRQNQKKAREWSKRKQDGMNCKDTDYPSAYMYIFDSDDTRIVKQRLGSHDRAGWQYLNPSKGPFKVYVSCKATAPKRFALYAFSPHGELHWEALDCNRESWMKEVGQRNAVDTMRENIYTDTHNTLDEYFHLGDQLLNDYPDVARQVRHVVSTISDMVDSDGIRCVAEGAADRVKEFVNSDQVQSVTNKVKDILGSEEAQEMVNQVGNFMNRAKSWWG